MLFDQIKQEKGKLDSIFANAGITPMTSLGNITEEAYDSSSTSMLKVSFLPSRTYYR